MKDVVFAVLPITIILLILNYTIAPIGKDLVLRFTVGALFIIFGLGIFLFGSDLAIQPIGQNIGSSITRKRSLPLLIIAGVFLGFLVNIAEPDLMVLAKQVQQVTNGTISQWNLLIVVSVGIGIMVAIGLLRIVFKISLSGLLTVLYAIIFFLVALSPSCFLGIAFDSGGATTGSMTVPFILALGLGVASTQGGKQSEEDSFGLVGIASAGPMLAVLSMGILSGVRSLTGNVPYAIAGNMGIFYPFLHMMPGIANEVMLALIPLITIFLILQVSLIRLPRTKLRKIIKGLVYTFTGFVLFLTGVYAGFMEAGTAVGHAVASYGSDWIVISTGFVLGFTVIFAEPAVYVLNAQIEEVTSGHIRKKNILYTLSIGVAIAVSLSMVRILVPGIQLWHLLIPGYIIAITLSHFAPKIFVGIAFDSGGVASGPMTATFILAFAQGVAAATPGADVLMEGFGVISMVALTPLVAIQVLGLLYKRKASKRS
jgi:hypothetical protein